MFGLVIVLITNNTFAKPNYQNYILNGKQVVQESFLERFLEMFKREPFQKSYAIIIAIGEYDYLPPLNSSKQDVEKMKDVLLRSGAYDEIVVLQDEHASFDNIRHFMQTYFPGKMSRSGRYRFLFYFTGHGGQYEGYDDKMIGLLLLKGAENRIDASESIDMRDLVKWADRFRYARHVLFLLDSCFSGLAGTEIKGGYDSRVNPLDLADENGRYIITAGSADQTSIANLNRWGGSLFTEIVVSGIQGYADSDDDKVVTTYELFNYVQGAVRNEAKEAGHKQTPLLSNLGASYKDTGQYFFVYQKPDIRDVSPAPDPGDIYKVPSPAVVPATPQPPTPTPTPILSQRISLRSEPITVSEEDAQQVFELTTRELHWGTSNSAPVTYIENKFEEQGKVVIDHATGLMWQKSGSDDRMNYEKAQAYVKKLNEQRFAGYNDWRLPTIPELMSLLEPEQQSNGLYIHPMFDKKQFWCWSADRRIKGEGSSGSAWLVGFNFGSVYWSYLDGDYDVRVVRS